ARIDRRLLPCTEGLNTLANVSQRRIQLPTQTVIQGQIRPDSPAVLSKQVNCAAAHVFDLSRPLRVSGWYPEQVIRKVVAAEDVICRRALEAVESVYVVVQGLIEAHAPDVDTKLHAVLA